MSFMVFVLETGAGPPEVSSQALNSLKGLGFSLGLRV